MTQHIESYSADYTLHIVFTGRSAPESRGRIRNCRFSDLRRGKERLMHHRQQYRRTVAGHSLTPARLRHALTVARFAGTAAGRISFVATGDARGSAGVRFSRQPSRRRGRARRMTIHLPVVLTRRRKYAPAGWHTIYAVFLPVRRK